MSAVPMKFKTGPTSYTPAELILGGQVVEARAASRVGVAAAGSLKALGVAVVDSINPEAVVTDSVVVNGRPTLNAAILPTVCPVAHSGIDVPVTYAAAAAFGDKLICAANGQVAPPVLAAGATPDARAIVGTCSAPAGVAAGAVGLVRTA